MPDTTTNFAINKPTGNENVTRDAYRAVLDQIDTALKAVEDTAASEMTTHKADATEHSYYAVDTGAANACVVTLAPAPTAYVDGLTVRVKIANASTGASTLNVNGLGAKTILDSNGNAIAPGGLKAGLIYTMCYNSTTGSFILQAKGGGTATAGDLISGKTATVDTGQITGTLALTGTAIATNVLEGQTFYNTDPKTKVTGTIASKAASVYTPGTADQTIAAGQYLSGAQTIKGDANLVAANIKSGLSLFGVAGSYAGDAYHAIASDDIIYCNVAPLANSTTTPLLVDSVNVRVGGTYRVVIGVQGYYTMAQIYKNGSPYGTQRYNNGTSVENVTYTEDLSFAAGDVISIYIWVANTNYSCTLSRFSLGALFAGINPIANPVTPVLACAGSTLYDLIYLPYGQTATGTMGTGKTIYAYPTTIYGDGYVSISYDAQHPNTYTLGHCQVYKNGSPIGTNHQLQGTTAWATYTETFSVANGDTFSLMLSETSWNETEAQNWHIQSNSLLRTAHAICPIYSAM